MSSMSFVVRGSDTLTEGWADRPLPFDPKGPMLVLVEFSPAGEYQKTMAALDA